MMESPKYFGHQGEVGDPAAFFQEQNYLVCRDVIDPPLIDSLVEYYESTIVNSTKRYLRQNGAWETHRKTAENGILNCLLDPHVFERGPNGELSRRILNILSSPSIQRILGSISGESKPFNLVQTMLFDHGTTGAHQDWIYLDTKPNGHLIAAWVALEDIHDEGIRFYVYPGTHHFKPKATYNPDAASHADFYAEFIREIQELIATGEYSMYAPALKKGDIFFWGSRIVHGSTAGTDPHLRRRSIAAHYIPDGYGFGNLSEVFNPEFGKRDGLTYAMRNLDTPFDHENNALRQSAPYKLAKKIYRSIIPR